MIGRPLGLDGWVGFVVRLQSPVHTPGLRAVYRAERLSRVL